jgi:hypothetical protein
MADSGVAERMEMIRQLREAMEEEGFTPTTDNGWIGTVCDVARLAREHAKKDPPMTTRLPDGTLCKLDAGASHWTDTYRLVPLSAEAGDQGTWMGGGLEITYPSAEAGDTDG